MRILPMPRRAALFLVLACVAGAALASSWVPLQQRLTPAQMHATGLDTLRADQLALLDQLLQDDAKLPTFPETEGKPPGVEAARAMDPTRSAGLTQAPIRARLVGSIAAWAPGTEFRLDNGQVWKVLKGSLRLRKPMDAPEVVLVPGFAGRWFLQVDEDLPKARVYRID